MENYGCTTHFSSFVAIDLRVFSPSRMAYYVLTTFITLFDPSKVYTRIFWYFLIEFEKKLIRSFNFNTLDTSSRYFQLFQFYGGFG